MDVHDPDDRDTSSDRPESPLPRRAHSAALFALHPVPSPRTPGDGPLPRRPDGPVPHPRAAEADGAIPGARSEPPPPVQPPTADTAPTGPVARMPVWHPADTPPMAWTPVAPPAAAPRRRTGLPVLESSLDRRVALALVVAVVLVASAALVLGEFGGPGTDTAEPAAPVGSAAAAPAGAPDLADGTTVVDAAAFGGAEPAFRSPTGNIDCRMSGDGARCAAGNRTWQLPAGVAECPPGVAGGVVLSGTGPAAPSCEGTDGAGSARTLDYGSALRSGATTCVSRRDGVECRSATSGHGFTIARSAYRVY